MALSLSILFLSASILSYEIIVIRLLAISHWQPFVTLAISTALLGYGLSGSVLVRIRKRVFPSWHQIYPALALAVMIVYRPVIYAAGRLHLDPGLIIRDPSQWLKVGYLIAVLTLPFFLASGALVLPLLERTSVGRYYGWNFVGAALGVMSVLVTIGILEPEDLLKVPILLAGLAVSASLFHFNRDRKSINAAAAVIVAAVLLFPTAPVRYGPYKDISYALRLPSGKIEAGGLGVTGRFQVIIAPALRSAAGLSTRYYGALPPQAVIYRSGDRMGTIILTDSPDNKSLDYLHWQTAAAPYVLLDRGMSTAIVGFSGGEEAARAIYHGLSKPVVIEPDRAIITLVRNNPDVFLPWIFGTDSAVFVSDSARSYFSARRHLYDLIVYPAGANLAAAASGLTGTAENFEITIQGMKAALENLKPGGIVALTGWNQFPPTGRWKLLRLFRKIRSLNEGGKFGGRVYIVSGWSNHSFMVSEDPFDPEELEKLSAFCKERGFTLIDGDTFPGPEETAFEGEDLWAHDLDLRPPIDSRPYPWHSLKLSYLKLLAGNTREAALPRVEWGFFFLIMVLVLTTVFALLALFVVRPGRKMSLRISIGIYFMCLGMGYMMTEIMIIKRSGLVMGPPAFTAAIVLMSFLLFSGFGSLTAGRMVDRERLYRWAFPSIVLFAGTAYILIPFLLTFSLPVRAVVLFLLAAPPAFAMGFPFPCALMLFKTERDVKVPWAWALNGYTSVVGSSLAGVLAVTMGFGALLLLSTASYVLAGWLFETRLRS